jgi:hypothetical protein
VMFCSNAAPAGALQQPIFFPKILLFDYPAGKLTSKYTNWTCSKSTYSGHFSISVRQQGSWKATFFCPYVKALVRQLETWSIMMQQLFQSSSIK